MPFPGVFHLVFFGVMRPWRAFRNRYRASTAQPGDRASYYRRVIIDASVCGLISILTLWSTLGALQLPPGVPGVRAWAIGLGCFAVMLGIDLAYTRRRLAGVCGPSERQSPQTTPERVWWGVLAVTTGVGEELTWRLVQPWLITQFTGSVTIGVIVSAATFGIGHISRGWLWGAAAVLFALIFQALTYGLAGGLYVAMAAHVFHNLTVGLVSGRWLAVRA
jgi:membrane protease YdiL (CAAX protease family)